MTSVLPRRRSPWLSGYVRTFAEPGATRSSYGFDPRADLGAPHAPPAGSGPAVVAPDRRRAPTRTGGRQHHRPRQAVALVVAGGVEPPASPLSGARSDRLSYATWGGRRDSNPRQPGSQPGALPTELQPPGWSLSDSNRPPPACKAGALPDELRPRAAAWSRQVSNLRPLRCERSALPLSYETGWCGAARRGLEPRSPGPTPGVLPLDDRAPCRSGGARTHDLLRVEQALYRLSYRPGRADLGPTELSGLDSNQRRLQTSVGCLGRTRTPIYGSRVRCLAVRRLGISRSTTLKIGCASNKKGWLIPKMT